MVGRVAFQALGIGAGSRAIDLLHFRASTFLAIIWRTVALWSGSWRFANARPSKWGDLKQATF
jgi:hypothetical protein